MKKLNLLIYSLSSVFLLYGCAITNSTMGINSPLAGVETNSPQPIVAKVLKVTPVSKSASLEKKETKKEELLTSPTNSQTIESPGMEASATEYEVIFQYNNQTYSTQLPFDPGENLMVQSFAPNTPTTNGNSSVTSSTMPGALIYGSNELYVLPPTALGYYPYPGVGFYTAFPVYFVGGYYHRLPGQYHLNPGNHFHHGGGRSRGRK